MKEYLEKQLDRRIVMSTAPDFKTYIERAAKKEYDIYETAPHFALLAERETGYRRVARLARELDVSIIVRKDDVAQRIEDLRGRTIVTPDALAISTILGEELLREHGLVAGKNYEVRVTPTHNNAIMSVYQNDAAAAFSSSAVFERVAPTIAQSMRVLAKTRQVPHMMIMAGPALSSQEYTALKRAMLAFTHDGAGKAFFDMTGYGDIAPITQDDMDKLEPYLSMLKERLR